MRSTLDIYRILYTIVVLGIWNLATVAQSELTFKQFKREQGLSQNSVIAIAQDQDGFIWLGTRKRLIKCRGYDFYYYNGNFIF